MSEDRPVVSVRDLVVHFRTGGMFSRKKNLVRAVDGVSFDVMPGETYALVGESGSGKSTTARAILGLEHHDAGSVEVLGHRIGANKHVPRGLRERMQVVFQDPYSSLDPSMRIVDTVAEPLDAHHRLSRAERQRKVEEALRQVTLGPDYLNRYPVQFSGGQRQRIAIARAIILRPALVVCDEAVSALDVSTQGQILNLLKELQLELGMAYLMISHDLAVVQSVSHRVAVMYLGRIVEEGPAKRVLRAPAHPYTASLLAAIPQPPGAPGRVPRAAFAGDSGDIPSPSSPPPGCRYHTRCPFVMDICRTDPPPFHELPLGGRSACHLHATGDVPSSGSVLPLLQGQETHVVEKT